MNLNEYLGGGEIFTVELSKFLVKNEIPHRVICKQDSFISTSLDINKIYWYPKSDNISYAKDHESDEIRAFLADIQLSPKDYFIPNALRELYILLDYLKLNKSKTPIIKYYILHPDEYKFLSRFSLFKKRIYDQNRQLFRTLYDKRCLISPNQNGLRKTTGINDSFPDDTFPFTISSFKETRNQEWNSNNGVIRILSVSRFVHFKVSSVLSLIKNCKDDKYELTIIGYGPWRFLVVFYIFVYKKFFNRKINLLGKQSPEDLINHIKNTDIGYAQGTSILQFCSYGIPTIVAPYSKWYQFLTKNIKSPGIFGLGSHLEFGDIYNGENFQSIDLLLNDITKNYNTYQGKVVSLMEEKLNKEIGLKRISDSLLSAGELINVDDIEMIRPNLFKIILMHVWKLFT